MRLYPAPPVRGAIPLVLSLVMGSAVAARGAQTPPDSSVFQIQSGSRLVVKTGKAGLFGFAGHTHVIHARDVSGDLVYHPGKPASSLRLKVSVDSLEVLTPPDTAEIRQVTEAMRTEVLHPSRYPEMVFAADSLLAKTGKMDMKLAVTMEGKTRKVPVTADVTIGSDTIRATGTFTAKQSDFGIKPFSGGPAGTVKVADKVTFCFDLVAVRGRAEAGGGPRADGGRHHRPGMCRPRQAGRRHRARTHVACLLLAHPVIAGHIGPWNSSSSSAAALGERYRVERELGHGGMAVVFLAQDLKHHRPVAIKLLKPELSAAIGSDRFLREIEIAATLQHPHILPLFDSGNAGGLLYYVMPFVEGESLRQRLAREPQLPLDAALQHHPRGRQRAGSTPTSTASSTGTSSRRTSCCRTARP